MKSLFYTFLFLPYLVSGQSVVSNRNCIWKDSAILYRGTSNELVTKNNLLFDSISAHFGEIHAFDNKQFHYRFYSGNQVQADTLHFFLTGKEIGRQFFRISNPGRDTLSWWENTKTISRAQLKENTPFILTNESGHTVFSSIIGFKCRYQESGSDFKSFPACDNNDPDNSFERNLGEFAGNQFPDCILSFLDSLPNGTVLHFYGFIIICPDCIARKLPIELQLKIAD